MTRNFRVVSQLPTPETDFNPIHTAIMKSLACIFFTLLLTLSAKASKDWKPPIGIPEPSWGALGNPIKLEAPTPPANWTSDVAGFYYVEQGGKNYGNGYPGNPRNAVPGTIPAGAVVFINGNYTGDLTGVYAPGTEASPAWICGYDPDKRPTLSRSKFTLNSCSYLFIDNINWDWAGTGNGKVEFGPSNNHIIFRNCVMSGVGSESGTSGADSENGGNVAFYSPSSFGPLEHIIFYKCLNTKSGNWLYASGDPDGHGLGLAGFVQDVWIVDCEFSYSSGCAIQFGTGTNGGEADATVCRRLYVGRCTAHHIAQTAFWAKRADTVIFSQCTAHTIRRDAPSSPNSGGFGSQYGTRNMWLIGCEVYNCQTAVGLGSNSLGAGANATPLYIVGCLFHKIHDLNGGVTNWRSDLYASSGVAIFSMGATGVVAVNNTITDVDAAIMVPNSIPVTAVNNIISNINPLGVSIGADSGTGGSINNNILTTPYVYWGGKKWTSVGTITAGTGNISTAPQFQGANDFRLKAGSPGIDAAGTSVPEVYATYKALTGLNIAVDRNGTPRPQNGKWDMGAYEFTEDGGLDTGSAPSKANTPRVRREPKSQ